MRSGMGRFTGPAPDLTGAAFSAKSAEDFFELLPLLDGDGLADVRSVARVAAWVLVAIFFFSAASCSPFGLLVCVCFFFDRACERRRPAMRLSVCRGRLGGCFSTRVSARLRQCRPCYGGLGQIRRCRLPRIPRRRGRRAS